MQTIALTKGIKLRCIGNKHGKYPITINKEYICENVSVNGTFLGIFVVNDNGRMAKYKTAYFDVANAEEELKNLWNMVC